jgi:anti-sigma regulatory factor (Ser/Thr protein kinase)
MSKAMSLTETDRFDEALGGGAPGTDPACVQESYAAIPSSVGAARRAIAALAAGAGANEEQLYAIRLASSEALSNVVQHAYPARTGQLHVTARAAANELWVLISDDGCGIQARPASSGLGVGLALISEMTDNFTVFERWSGGTELRLRFVLHPGDEDRDHDRGSVSSATRPAASRFSTTT